MMDPAARTELETSVRRHCERGEHAEAATASLRLLGPEIFGFLVALHRNEEDASDVFSTFSEDLWRGLPTFAWECPLRAWTYTLARNASHRFRKISRRHVAGHVPLSQAGELGQLVERVRTETLNYLRTEQKDRFAALRESLSLEDRTLLILRVDRRMPWEELARITLAGEPAEISDERIKKESARLRKRFQVVKEKLVSLGEKAGLLPPKGRKAGEPSA